MVKVNYLIGVNVTGNLIDRSEYHTDLVKCYIYSSECHVDLYVYRPVNVTSNLTYSTECHRLEHRHKCYSLSD